MPTKRDPFDELPDNIMPEPLEPQDDETLELDPEVLAGLVAAAPKSQARINRLLRRNLDKEVSILYKFLDSGLQHGIIRVASRSEGDSLRNKLYYARKQEEYRILLMEPGDSAARQRDRHSQLMNLAFSVRRTDTVVELVDRVLAQTRLVPPQSGWLLEIYVQSPLVLEPYNPEDGIA